MHPALAIFSQNYPDWEGTKALNLLLNHPHEPVYASILERCLYEGISPAEVQANLYHLAPIRMTDETTLTAIKKRLNELISLQASRAANDSASADDDAEINALTAYLKKTTLPTGAIKCFGDEDTKAYNRIREAIRRLLKKAEADGYLDAVAIIKANLKQGKMFSFVGLDAVGSDAVGSDAVGSDAAPT